MSLQDTLRQVVRNVPDFPKPGIQFKDITPVLESPVLCRAIILEFLKRYEGIQIDAVAGIESRGFLFGLPLAMELNVPFILMRKRGKLPSKTLRYTYALEYGTAEIEMHEGSVSEGMKVLIHDDLLATGGTAEAAAELVDIAGGEVAGFAFIIELSQLAGRDKLIKYNRPMVSLIDYKQNEI